MSGNHGDHWTNGARPPRVLVTGANGFIGRFVVQRLADLGAAPVAAVRRAHAMGGIAQSTAVAVSSSDSVEFMTEKLRGCDAVVHLAAVVHDPRGTIPEPRVFEVNLEWSRRLAEASIRAGIGRFVFGSTIKVNGESTAEGRPFDEESTPDPAGAYALSKHAAERALQALAREAGMALTVVRPPLVYGPGVRANFFSLIKIVDRGLPLPFGAVENLRSLIYVENYADFLVRLALGPGHPEPRTFLISDGEDLSTPELVRKVASALRRPAHLLNVPPLLLMRGAKVFRREGAAQRLLGSLQVDSRRARRELEWVPPFTVDLGLARTAAWFHSLRRGT